MTTPIDLHKAGLARFRQSEEFSDCRIVCGAHEFNVHKLVLSTQSEYFRAALKRGTFKEGESGVIELKAKQDDSDTDESCDEPEIVRLMIEYFYHFDYLRDSDPAPTQAVSPLPRTRKTRTAELRAYPGFGNSPASSPAVTAKLASNDHLVDHAKVFAVAVKYQVDGLRDLAIIKFKNSLSLHWNHEDFGRAISVVYSSTPDNIHQLRDLVSDAIHEHFDVLHKKPEVEVAVVSINKLAYDLLKRSRLACKCKGTKRKAASFDGDEVSGW